MKAGPFIFAELRAVTSLDKGEIRECINRGIISAPAGVGQGNHRAYTKWNLIEGVIAAALLRDVRAGSVATLALDADDCPYRPGDLPARHRAGAISSILMLFFPPRTEPDIRRIPHWARAW